MLAKVTEKTGFFSQLELFFAFKVLRVLKWAWLQQVAPTFICIQTSLYCTSVLSQLTKHVLGGECVCAWMRACTCQNVRSSSTVTIPLWHLHTSYYHLIFLLTQSSRYKRSYVRRLGNKEPERWLLLHFAGGWSWLHACKTPNRPKKKVFVSYWLRVKMSCIRIWSLLPCVGLKQYSWLPPSGWNHSYVSLS